MGHDEEVHGTTTAPAAASVRPTGVRYLVLAAACSLAVLTYVQRQGFVAGTPSLKKDLGLDDEQMGYLASVWLVAYGLFQVPGGLLGDRLGGRLLLTLLVLTWSLLSGAVALAVLLPAGTWLPFAFLTVLRFLFGMFQAGGFPGLARVLADWMPQRQRGFAQGLVWTCSRVGGFLAPLLVLWLIGLCGGWAVPLWLLASLGLVWSAFFWQWFRNRPGESPRVNAAERALIESGRPAGRVRPPPLPWSRFPGSRTVWGLCLMYGCGGFAGNFITSLLPIYLKDHRHLTHETTAWLSGLPLAFGAVSCVLGGVLSDWLIRRTGSRKWGRRLVGCVGMALAGVAILSTIWTEEVWILGLLFSVTFFLNDASMGPAWASCADVGEHYAGTLSGAMNMIGAFAGAAGMALAGALFKRDQDEVVFVVFACSYALAALCWFAVDVTRPLVPTALEKCRSFRPPGGRTAFFIFSSLLCYDGWTRCRRVRTRREDSHRCP
jgi:ACS family glucarate transporter-like MFS transporter